MHSHPHSPLVATLLQHLASEEALLRDALAVGAEVFAELRRGDLAAAVAASARQAEFGAALREAGAARSAATTALAAELGLPRDAVTLAALAAQLPDPLALDVRAARARLTALTTDLNAVQTRNANLISHLRQFFRGVLSDLTGSDAPLRYGPSGNRVGYATGAAPPPRG